MHAGGAAHVTGDGPVVWYAAYGTNLSTARLTCYLSGGRPPGAARRYDGCRDPSPPRDVRPVELPGRLSFAGESSVWGGGMAFYTPGPDGVVHARAYLLRLEQLGDLVAQEARASASRPNPSARPSSITRTYDADGAFTAGTVEPVRVSMRCPSSSPTSSRTS